jgi:hypothetical protein
VNVKACAAKSKSNEQPVSVKRATTLAALPERKWMLPRRLATHAGEAVVVVVAVVCSSAWTQQQLLVVVESADAVADRPPVDEAVAVVAAHKSLASLTLRLRWTSSNSRSQVSWINKWMSSSSSTVKMHQPPLTPRRKLRLNNQTRLA